MRSSVCSGRCGWANSFTQQPAVGDVEYSFKHALTQEVAYNSLLSERRKAIHLRAGAAIEASFSGRLEASTANWPHHYLRGGKTARRFITWRWRHIRTWSARLIRRRWSTPRRGLSCLLLCRAIPSAPAWNWTSCWSAAPPCLSRRDQAKNRHRMASGRASWRVSSTGRAIFRGHWGRLLSPNRAESRAAARQLAQEGFSISRRLRDPVHEAFHRAYLGLLSSLDGELSARENCEQALAAPTSEPHSSRIMRVTESEFLGVLAGVWDQGLS